MKTFYPPNGREREGKAITAGPSTMCLASKCRRGGRAGRLEEARGRGREAEIGFREMQLANIVVAPVSVLISLCHVGRRDGQFGGDLEEGMLSAREAELVLE